ncbi:SusC/RagA family TonB-linked outer membrane protein [Wenyingzhuangia sp. 1_MG-2023]|nr:SusC/RagA family TonB-linked outer membrane protein [Wenyingzhuangia sp. 1_MG-2023]
MLFFNLLISTSVNLYANTIIDQVNTLPIIIENISIRECISKIENKTDYVFIQSGIDDTELNKKIKLKTEGKTIDNLCEQMFESTNINYKVINKQIVLFKKKNSLKRALQEMLKLSGQVQDVSGNLLSGVTLMVKNEVKKWAMTDFEGKFNIEGIPVGSVVKVSSMGYETQEITVNESQKITITLKEDIESLEEVIVTSNYGTVQKKSDLVSSAYQVKSEDIKNMPQQRVDRLLEGIIPGLEVSSQSNGATSSRPRYSVSIRGDASLTASNEPLWIVDGIQITTGGITNSILGVQTSVSPLSFLNPNDIESITVLKDASATTIYGADGANGVILITTKKGKIDHNDLEISVRHGISFINKDTRFKVLNAKDYLTLAQESYLNSGGDPAYFPYMDNDMNSYSTTETDWYDEFFDVGSTSQINLSASGGNQKAVYRISGSYFEDKMTLKGNKQQRMSISTNNNINFNDKLNLNFLLSGSYNVNTTFTPGDDYYSNLPIISPYNDDGTFRQYYKVIEGSNSDGTPNWVQKRFFNELAEREQNDNGQKAFSFKGSVQLSYKLSDVFKLSSQFGVDYNNYAEKIYQSMKNWSGTNSGVPVGYANDNNAMYLNWNTIHRLNFNKQVGLHRLSGVVGIELGSNQTNVTSSSGSGFVNDHVRLVSLASFSDGSASEYTTTKASYLSQLSYHYDGRYNLVLNWRKDGNSNFGKNVQYATFLSVGASWNLHKEDFFKSRIIDILSLKGSYGTNGNSRYGSKNPDGVYSISDSYQYGGTIGAGISTGANPDLSWETTYITNLGFRIALWGKRLDITTEFYRNKTTDLISTLDASRTIGDTTVLRNIGAIENKGVEITLESTNIQKENFTWKTKILASRNRNKILELYNNVPKNYGNIRLQEGKSKNTFFLVRWAGVDPRDGYPMWYDTEGNITKDYSVDNRVADKIADPDLFGSISNIFNYKNQYVLSVLMSYTIGGYSFSTFARDVNSDGLNIMDDNQSVNQLERWKEEGDLALAPQPIWGVSTGSVRNSTRFLYSKTNMKIRNVSFSYLFDKRITKSMGVETLGVSLIANNLLVWTPYDKSDRNSYKNNIEGYPLETEISLGINVKF